MPASSLTQDGVVVIDSGHNPIEGRKLLEVIKKLTSMPVRMLIDTEPHPDHTTAHFIFARMPTNIDAAYRMVKGNNRAGPRVMP